MIRQDGMDCSAVFSGDRVRRYLLLRQWDYFNKTRGLVAFVGLNPSTATETEDDPTVRRCINFARDWGYGGMAMLNVFAFRATDPRVMKAAPDPVGSDNDTWIERWTSAPAADLVVACWGVHGDHLLRGRHVSAMLREHVSRDRLRVFGLTKDRHPKHPLYLAGRTQPKEWR